MALTGLAMTRPVVITLGVVEDGATAPGLVQPDLASGSSWYVDLASFVWIHCQVKVTSADAARGATAGIS